MNANISVLVKVLHEMNVAFEVLHPAGNLIKITGTDAVFANHLTPYNSDVHGLICKDKDFQQKLLPEGMFPKTKTYLDPQTSQKYRKYVKFDSVHSIAGDVLENFSLPVIIKPNRLSTGQNVFLCKSQEEIEIAVQKIFANTKYYDYLLLAQEYLHIEREYRVVWFNGKIRFMYLKDVSEAEFQDNMSPLHWKNAKAVDIFESSNIWQEALNISQTVSNRLGLEYFGLDLAWTHAGDYRVIEINGGPGFSKYIRDCGSKKVENLYQAMIEKLA